MSIRKNLIAVAAMALALMGFASSAMAATDGVVRDVTTGAIIANGAKEHYIGWMRWGNELGGISCHVTLETEATGTAGTTGKVTVFSMPDLTKCTGDTFFAGCTVTAETTTNLPYAVTNTPADFDVAGVKLDLTFGNCFVSSTTLEGPALTLKPLKTGTRTVTNTLGHLGTTAATGEPIAGAELSGTLTATGIGTAEVSGEFELTEPARCTYKLVAS